MSFATESAKLTGAVFAHLSDGLAVFTPKSGAVVADVPVIIAAPDVMAGLNEARAVVADARIECPVSALAVAPKKGDTFTLGATVYECVDRGRRREDDATVWAVDVQVRS